MEKPTEFAILMWDWKSNPSAKDLSMARKLGYINIYDIDQTYSDSCGYLMTKEFIEEELVQELFDIAMDDDNTEWDTDDTVGNLIQCSYNPIGNNPDRLPDAFVEFGWYYDDRPDAECFNEATSRGMSCFHGVPDSGEWFSFICTAEPIDDPDVIQYLYDVASEHIEDSIYDVKSCDTDHVCICTKK